MRAYDILTERRAARDLRRIARHRPSAASCPTGNAHLRGVGKYASNTMAATIFSAVLVGGYTLFGLFSKPPSAAEIEADSGSARATLQAFAAALPVLPTRTESAFSVRAKHRPT